MELKTGLLSILLIALPSLFFAQQRDTCQYEFKGVVRDADTKEPIPYVRVQIKGEASYQLTDEKGRFHLRNRCEQEALLTLECFGYCDTICEQHHEHGKSPHIDLKQKVTALSNVEIEIEQHTHEGTSSMSQTSIELKNLETNPTKSLASAVADLPGVTLISMGSNVQLPVIHGLYGNRVLVLNNGLKHGFQNWGADHAPEIDLSTADRITVLKGAAGVQFGPEALGGAVIVESAPLHLNEPLQINLGSGYQTNGKGYFVTGRITEGGKRWSYHVGGKYERRGDLHAPDYMLTNTGKEETSMNAGLRYHQNNIDVKLYYSFVDQTLGLLRSSVTETAESFEQLINLNRPLIVRDFSYDIGEPKQETQHHLAKIEAVWWYSADARLTFRVGGQSNLRKEFDVRRNRQKPIIDLDLSTLDMQVEWKHPDWFQLDGIIGVQRFTQDNDNNPGTGTTAFIPNYNTTRYSAFVIENLHRGKNTYEAGVRWDFENNNVRGREPNQDIFRDEYSFGIVTSSLGWIRKLSETATLRNNVGASWRTPNMPEVYSFGQHGPRLTFGLLRSEINDEGQLDTREVESANSGDLQPESGLKWIGEWDKKLETNTLMITGYTQYLQNFTFERPAGVIGSIRGPMPAFFVDQTDALFLGGDLTWKCEWTPSIQGTLAANYLWSKDVKNDQPLINQPPITLHYNLEWTKDFWRFHESKFWLKPRYTFRQFQAPETITPGELIFGEVSVDLSRETFDFMEAPDGYFLLDLGWSFQFHALEASISLQNALNNGYRDYLNEFRYFADEPGRNLLFTINYLFNSKPKPNENL